MKTLWKKPEKKKFIIYGDGPNTLELTVEIELDSEMSIEDLKSVILKETKGQPFFFKFLLNNNQKLSDLEKEYEKWNEYYKQDYPLEVFLNREKFSLWFTNKSDGSKFMLEGLNEETSLTQLKQMLNQKVEKGDIKHPVF